MLSWSVSGCFRSNWISAICPATDGIGVLLMSGQGQVLTAIVDFGRLPAGQRESLTHYCLPNKSLKTQMAAKRKTTERYPIYTHLSVNFQLALEPLSWHVNLFAFAGQSEWESAFELESESRITIESLRQRVWGWVWKENLAESIHLHNEKSLDFCWKSPCHNAVNWVFISAKMDQQGIALRHATNQPMPAIY